MKTGYRLELALYSQLHDPRLPLRVCIDLDCVMPDREALERLAFDPNAFSGAVHIMQDREMTTAHIAKGCAMLGAKMKDMLEDAYGWHGEDRRDAVRAAYGQGGDRR